MKTEIKRGKCCEHCDHWVDKDQLSGWCKENEEETQLSDTCDLFTWLRGDTEEEEKYSA